MKIAYISRGKKKISFSIQLDSEEDIFAVGQGNSKVELVGNTFSFELPFAVKKIHSDLVALSLLTIVLPWIKERVTFPEKVSLTFAEKVKQIFGVVVENADESIAPRSFGKIDAVSFSGGVDSVATSCLLPDDHIKVMFLRSDHSIIDCKNVNYSVKAQKQVSDHFENSYYVKSDLEHIVGPYPQYPTWVTIASPCFLLADHFNFKSVNFGSIVGSSDIKNGGKYKKHLNPNADWKELFLAVGIYLSKPVSAVTEIGTSTIVKKAGLNEVATSCQFGTMDNPCMKCFKCFRKYLMSSAVSNAKLDKKIIDNFIKLRAVQDYFLSSPPVYFQHILMYAFTQLDCGKQSEAFQLFREKVLLTGLSVKWCEKSYNKALDRYVPEDKLRDFIVNKLRGFLPPMDKRSEEIFENWDLYKAYGDQEIKNQVNDINQKIKTIFEKQFNYQDDNSSKKSEDASAFNYSLDKEIALSFKKKSIDKEIFQDKIKDIIYYGKIPSRPKISVMIVTYGDNKEVIRCIKSITHQRYQDYEIIVFDNGLNQDIVSRIKQFNLMHIIAKDNFGPSVGRNVAACYAKGELLVSIDDDGYVDEDYLENAWKLMQDKEIVAARGKVVQIDEDNDKEFQPAHYDLGEKQIPSLIDIEGNTVFRREDFLRVGGMEEELYGHEGVVLHYRMVEFYGYARNSFVYDPSLLLHHDYHFSLGGLEKKTSRYSVLSYKIRNKYPLMRYLTDYYREIKEGVKLRNKPGPESSTQKLLKEITSKVNIDFQEQLKKGGEQKGGDRKKYCQVLKPYFSVIIPCYNLGDLLPKAINSVFAQTLENIEVIVVDDCSQKRETKKVLNRLEREQEVKVIRLKENSGVSVARNTGIESAKGRYILCLDADDYIESTYLEKAFNIFESDNSVGIVSCWLKTFGIFTQEWKPLDGIEIKRALINSPVHTASCFRKADWERGGIYDANLRGKEDWDHWLRIMKIRPKVRVIPEFLFNYYVRAGSKVETSNKNAIQLLSRIIENHRELYEKNYSYVITRQHKHFADSVNRQREGGCAQGGSAQMIERLERELNLVKSSKFWKIRSIYLKLKHYFIFIFLNPGKFFKRILVKSSKG